ncbi:biotin-dependent carboxyltransferase family protein [Spirilliplanes yamanashiensis]|uniref:Allophanate hydrolase n=1 Tax=Spirilliplanes yamanashiensis TaxID=42233 RepID=A0A8J4DI39_9ACTN|nr:biotin-dependent carboxyltransferase family protein [Spirilliplanes yamanashiensis]MDP9815056.1 biotin-dependent carboxylase-like uncharacterized protein [Spirilliplanes yamanashiensis]GIJ02712.1 allophanate hydrolase [Spirilliplanes yamanashiensis]
MIEVVRAGPLTTVQDLGRPGFAHLGVPRSGALDQPALRRANRLAGNPGGAAALETTVGGCAVRVRRDTVVAVTGARARVRVDRAEVAFGAAVPVPAGAVLDVGPARAGVRSYVAFAGGVAVEPVLGSRSTDTLSGLGPPPLADGMTLPLGTPGAAPAAPDLAEPGELVVTLGPRDDWFADPDALFTTDWTVSPLSNRVGLRLSGPPLRRAEQRELPSEGVVLGAVQVPADGRPLVFLADHPTTGGYPVIGVVADVTPLAQARPGTTVRFHGPQR